MAVRTEEFVVSAQPERLARSLRNRPLSSAARCWASAALPPFPKNRILFPERRHFVIASATLTTELKYPEDSSRLCINDAQSRILATARDCAASAFIGHLRPSAGVHEVALGWASLSRNGSPGPYSKLILSCSTTSGRFCTRVWMVPMYSPMIPINSIWIDMKKNTPMTNGATPTEKLLQKISLYRRYASNTRTETSAPTKPEKANAGVRQNDQLPKFWRTAWADPPRAAVKGRIA